MENKYILSSLCSITPVIRKNGLWRRGISAFKYHSENQLTAYVLLINGNQICQEDTIIGKLVIPKNERTVGNIPIRKIMDKGELCMIALSKYKLFHHIVHNYGNSNGINLMLRNTKLRNYTGYSTDIRDYTNNYDVVTMKNFLVETNKLISQNSKCISVYQIGAFRSILKMLLNLNPDPEFENKITTTLLDKQIFSNVFYKYIRGMDYYTNLGELFKNV